MRHGMARKNSQKMYRCFGCFHVRSGALALGTWHLTVHMLALFMIAYVSVNLDEINQNVNSLTIYIRRSNPQGMSASESDEPIALPSQAQAKNTAGSIASDMDLSKPLVVDKEVATAAESKQEDGNKVVWYWSSYIYSSRLNADKSSYVTQRDLNMAFIYASLTALLALMMVLGIVKGKPGYILPFLAYQWGDLLVSCLTVAGVVCYGPAIKQYALSDEQFPFHEEIAQLDNEWVTLFLALGVMAIVFVKAYFIQIVWMCVRYIREEKIRRAREECQPKVIYLDDSSLSMTDGAQPNNYTTLFMFEDDGSVVKKSPPPAYSQVPEEDKTAPPVYTTTA
ncbi:hypothetical protein RvY_17064 [Ramazzottius varieornatus]|uniref:Lysosomal-associated transmembrane protein 4A n=1 Tax=Ramazzottius varieornatus TaxID=947166 RepID=A0A1D1W376_RAMVA|nr:hypothetical protein RvY_17064 [Ramazzottius varieornatus]